MIHEPQLAEAAALTELLNAHSTELHGESDLAVDTVRHWFDLDGLWIRVAERNGDLVGYLDVTSEDQDRRFQIDARAVDDEAAGELVGSAEAHCRGAAAAGAVMRGHTDWADDRMRAAYERAGFEVVRHFFEMRTGLADVTRPEWPNGIAVRGFCDEDEDAVWDCFNETFADHWDHQPPTAERRAHWRHNTRGPWFEHDLWFLAEDAGGELAGMSLCAWHHSGDRTFGWVQILGVRRAWRRRGLALALLRDSFAELAARGVTRVGLGVDAASPTGAVDLYERAGMHVQRRSATLEKAL
ncbi:MAG: GNAT family N-acetyltransferase [Gaiellaceae bacterium]